MLATIIPVALLLYAAAILFFIPTREVTQPPGRFQMAWEMLFPGISPAWRMLGGLVLVAWCYFVLQDLLILKIGSPYVIATVALPNLKSAYGVPVPGGEAFSKALFRPSWVWMYLAPAILFVANLFLVLRARRRA